MRKALTVIMMLAAAAMVEGKSYPKSDHFDGEKFHNLETQEMNSFWDFLKWKLEAKASWPEYVTNKDYPLPVLTPQNRAVATFINHATFLIQLPGLTILTDPVYSARVSPFSFIGPERVREPGVAFESLPAVDVVLISHNHYDHLDLATLKNLDAKFHPLIIAPLGLESFLKKEGLQNVIELDWWQDHLVKDVLITLAPAQHWSSRTPFDKRETLWGSFMIASPQFKTYFAGDTGYASHFKDVRTRLGAPDLALLPIGAYEPRWFMKIHHMDPFEAIEAHLDLGAEKSVGMHFGTFQVTNEGYDRPVQDLKEGLEQKNVSSDDFKILDQGQSLHFN
jgi:L-ascorbate metabolism protein UlaG (beta-lactamase superfamily)